MRFQIHKHFRGFIISGVDDILQALEDSTLLLNGMFHLLIDLFERFLRDHHFTICWYLSSASRTMDSNIIIDFRSD
jgi:hypothetical protein